MVGIEDKPKKLIAGHIELGHVLGSGGFGKVYFGYDIKKKRKVAVKMIDKQLIERQDIGTYVEREIEMMRKIKNKHIVTLLEAIETSKAYNLVLELAPNGELFDKIVDSHRFDEHVARSYFQQLIDAVHYCHKINIAHRDLKAENLLLGENNILKVCDFGLSRYTRDEQFNDNEILFTSLAGSIDYQAPEVLKECGYNGTACDMWSCGCILFFMLCGYLPFTDRSDGLTRKRILSCQYNRHNRYLSTPAADLIEHLLLSNPVQRYTSLDVIRHPWFQIDLDPSLFPDEEFSHLPQSPVTSHEFIERVLSPQNSGSFTSLTLSPTAELTDELHQAFTSCNIMGDGFLDKGEVRDALIKLNDNIPVSEEEVENFMANFQLDNQGRITEEEFVLGWTTHLNELGKKYDIHRMVNLFHYDLEKEFLQELRQTFDLIDTEHSGVITVENIKSLGLGLSDEEIKTLFEAIEDEGSYNLSGNSFGNNSHGLTTMYVSNTSMSSSSVHSLGNGNNHHTIVEVMSSSNICSSNSPTLTSSPITTSAGVTSFTSHTDASTHKVTFATTTTATTTATASESSEINHTKKSITTLTFERFVSLCLKYDLLKNRPLARRLRQLENFFSITEHTSFKSYLNTGYTVAGSQDVIKSHLMSQQGFLKTNFEADGVNGFLYGTFVKEGKKVLEVGVRLLPAAKGYTKVFAYRIRGKTSDFHEWFLGLRRAMKEQLLRCEEDTAVKGQPELMEVNTVYVSQILKIKNL